MNAGLCGVCRYRRIIESGRGSTFLLCRRAATDPRYRKYPPLPKLACPGFEPGDPDSDEARPSPHGEGGATGGAKGGAKGGATETPS